MDFIEIGVGGLAWIELAHVTDAVMNIWDPYNFGNILTS
jgi:hypothetical protein